MSRLLTTRIYSHLKTTPILFKDIEHSTVHTKTLSPVSHQPSSGHVSNPFVFLMLFLGGGVTLYLFTKRENKHPTFSSTNIYTQHEFSPSGLIGDSKFKRQERNFAENSTYLYQGVLYMSPASFIRLVTQVPNGISNKSSNSVHKVETEQVKNWLQVTSSKRKSKHDQFLKDIWNDGILSYPDYRSDRIIYEARNILKVFNRLLPKSYDRNKHPKRPFSLGKITNFTRKLSNFGTFLKLKIS